MFFSKKICGALVSGALILLSNSLGAVGGYSQVIMVHNQTDRNATIECEGGDSIKRKERIRLAPKKAGLFLRDYLVEPFSNLLGGSYRCSIKLDGDDAINFSTVLEDAQEIRVWSIGKDFFSSGNLACQKEYFGNFNRPSAILDALNSGGEYRGESCTRVRTRSRR